MRRGDIPDALRWLENAWRLTHGAADVAAAYGAALLVAGDRRSIDVLAESSSMHAVPDLTWLLVRARALLGDYDGALATFTRGLQCFAPDPDLAGIVANLIKAADAPGWCGLSALGHLRVFPVARVQPGRLAVHLDGRVRALTWARTKDGYHATLPRGWWSSGKLSVLVQGRELVGSPIDIQSITRVEGFAENDGRSIKGWIWFPNDPASTPYVEIAAPGKDKTVRVVADDMGARIAHPHKLARPRGFHVDADAVNPDWDKVHVRTPFGKELAGAPLHLDLEERNLRASVWHAAATGRKQRGIPPLLPLPAVPVGMRTVCSNRKIAPRRGVDVVVPVYGGLEETRLCLDSVLATMPRTSRLIIVDDCAPDPALKALVQKVARHGSVDLIVNKVNRGFPGAANAGIAAASRDRDVILLNSDTIVPRGLVDRLRKVAHAAPAIGTVTPLSNDATIMSYPNQHSERNETPRPDEVQGIAEIVAQANGLQSVDVPTAVGFCMYMRRECLDEVGVLREDIFAQGYGEENDFCLRASQLGWRHVAATGIYVAHSGSASFGAAKRYLSARNGRWINRLHPGYDSMIARFVESDPLAPMRRRIDLARLDAQAPRQNTTIVIAHGKLGGVRKHITDRQAEIEGGGASSIVLLPQAKGRCRIDLGDESFPNLIYSVGEEWDALVGLLASFNPDCVELHHFMGHDPRVMDLPDALGVPLKLIVHDYSWFCTRVHLMDSSRKYCGEPDLAACEQCYSDLGSALEEDIRPTALVARSADWLAKAETVVVPSADVAKRLRRHFPTVRPVTEAWEGEPVSRRRHARPRDVMERICLIGAIGHEKGYDILFDCAHDAARRELPIEFHLIGYSCDDRRLLETGKVFITGPYEEAELDGLIDAQHASVGLLPSILPETWSYALSAMMRSGLAVLSFDIGAQAERLRRYKRGRLVPLATPASALNGVLLQMLAEGPKDGALEKIG